MSFLINPLILTIVATSSDKTNSSQVLVQNNHKNIEGCASLFTSKTKAALQVAFKEISDKSSDWTDVQQAYKASGLKGRVVSVSQPTKSNEKNSQNFVVVQECGERILFRRCSKFKGKDRFESTCKMLCSLRQDGVNVPEFYSSPNLSGIPYFELNGATGNTSWSLFKYIDADTYFSGSSTELRDAAEQLGKMHASLKKNYGIKVMAIPQNADQVDSAPGPSFPKVKWDAYLKIIEAKLKDGGDAYDADVMANKSIIDEMIAYVESNFKLLEDAEDLQNIHFDLNSMNLLVDKTGHVRIMDFDEVKLGNIYTDIGFALHRFITTGIEQGRQDTDKAVQEFIQAYKKGNPGINIDMRKLIAGAYNRALRNLKTNFEELYIQGKTDWKTSMPINILRLKQVKHLTGLIQSCT